MAAQELSKLLVRVRSPPAAPIFMPFLREVDDYIGSSTFAWQTNKNSIQWIKSEAEKLKELRQKQRIQALVTNSSDVFNLTELSQHKVAAHSGNPVTCVTIAYVDVTKRMSYMSHYQTLTPKNIWEAGHNNLPYTQKLLDDHGRFGLSRPDIIRGLIPLSFRLKTISAAYRECQRLLTSESFSNRLHLLVSGIIYNTQEENQLSIEHIASLTASVPFIQIHTRLGEEMGIYASLNHPYLEGFGFYNLKTRAMEQVDIFS